MQISSRFTMAIHMFACIDAFSDQKMTSDFMAASIGTNPVIIGKLLQQLKAAGIIEVSRGTGESPAFLDECQTSKTNKRGFFKDSGRISQRKKF